MVKFFVYKAINLSYKEKIIFPSYNKNSSFVIHRLVYYIIANINKETRADL